MGLVNLKEALKVYEREVTDMTREFGELYFAPLGLNTTIGYLLDACGEVAKSKTLRMQIRDQIEKKYGIGHRYYIQSMLTMVNSHIPGRVD